MTVSTIASKATGAIQSAIAYASQATGIDFDYLLGQAKLESGLNPSAKAGTSSAAGLYQFLDQSWLAVVKKHGAEHGLSWAANSIGSSGSHLSVSDPATRQAIMALRQDPQVSSLMAAEYASDNKDGLEASLGRTATGTDLYMAHFLGLGGARQFLTRMASNPDASAASLFPTAAAANRAVFYDKSGNARSLQQIYDWMGARLNKATGGATAAATATSTATGLPQAIEMAGATVVTGAGETGDTALAWAQSTLGQLSSTGSTGINLLRPTPDTARLAYMMLASMGG